MHEARVAKGRLNTALPLVTSIYNTRCMVYVTGRSNQCCHSALASNRGFSPYSSTREIGLVQPPRLSLLFLEKIWKGCDVYLSVVTVIPDTTSCARIISPGLLLLASGLLLLASKVMVLALLVLFLLLLLVPLKSFH